MYRVITVDLIKDGVVHSFQLFNTPKSGPNKLFLTKNHMYTRTTHLAMV